LVLIEAGVISGRHLPLKYAFRFAMAIGVVVNPKDALLSEHVHRVLLSMSAFFSSVAGPRGSSA
jgi:hypothetical protein